MCNRRVFVDTSFFNQAHTWVEILLLEISRFSTLVENVSRDGKTVLPEKVYNVVLKEEIL